MCRFLGLGHTHNATIITVVWSFVRSEPSCPSPGVGGASATAAGGKPGSWRTAPGAMSGSMSSIPLFVSSSKDGGAEWGSSLGRGVRACWLECVQEESWDGGSWGHFGGHGRGYPNWKCCPTSAGPNRIRCIARLSRCRYSGPDSTAAGVGLYVP